MINAICEFAKSGNPNCAELPKWEPGYKKAMIFCENTQFTKLPGKLLWKTHCLTEDLKNEIQP